LKSDGFNITSVINAELSCYNSLFWSIFLRLNWIVEIRRSNSCLKNLIKKFAVLFLRYLSSSCELIITTVLGFLSTFTILFRLTISSVFLVFLNCFFNSFVTVVKSSTLSIIYCFLDCVGFINPGWIVLSLVRSVCIFAYWLWRVDVLS